MTNKRYFLLVSQIAKLFLRHSVFFFLAVGVKRLFLKIVLLMNFFYIIN